MKLPPLVVKKIINAAPEQVFAAWSKPELMQQWFFPNATWHAVTKNDFRVGGHYRHEMISEEGNKYLHQGEYGEIVPLKKIVFTWNSHAVTDTIVTVELNAVVDNKTEVILTHDLFKDEEEKRKHQEGWNVCLDNLNNSL